MMNKDAHGDLTSCFQGLAAIDLEVSLETSRIKSIGATRVDREVPFTWQGSKPGEGIGRLAEYLKGASLVVGHNLENFDLAHLSAEVPGASMEEVTHLDTLWLAALAWPEPRTLRLKKAAGKAYSEQYNQTTPSPMRKHP